MNQATTRAFLVFLLAMFATTTGTISIGCSKESPRSATAPVDIDSSEDGQTTKPEDSSLVRDLGAKPGGLNQDAETTEADAHVRILTTLPEFVLVDQWGEPFGTSQLRGKVWVATFIFTRCQRTCLIQTAQMARLQEQLKEHSMWDDVRLVSFSVDPIYDTSKVLREYARQWNADEQHWRFLTGSRDQIWQLSKERFKLPVGDDPGSSDMPLFHSAKLVLVDRLARIRGYYDGLSQEGLQNVQRDLNLVLNEAAPLQQPKTSVDEGNVQTVPVPFPAEIIDPPWLEGRKSAQFDSLGKFKVFYGFQFTDRLEESDIRFVNRAVEDAGKEYKAVHYDHGNGIAVADVDGDGHYDVYFVSQLGGNELWRNLGNGQFEDITELAGVAIANRVGVTASFADIDNDGDPDLYVTTVRNGNVLLENDGSGKFRDISKESGLDYVGHSSAAVFFDYNRDGLLDVFLANVGIYTTDSTGADGYYVGLTDAFAGHLKPRGERSILFKNMGGNRFGDVSNEVNLIDNSWTGDASPVDVNSDGWPDLYILDMQGHDEYYENVEGKRFLKKSRAVFPKTPWGSMGIKVFDYNNDGEMDIFVTDMHTDMVENLPPHREKDKMPQKKLPPNLLKTDGNHVLGNAFYRNDGTGAFNEISEEIGAENYWPWGLSVGDLNADGYDDVFIASSMNYPYRYGVNSVLLNNQGEEFLDSEFILGVEPRRDGRTAKPWFELDCGGDDFLHTRCQGRNDHIVVWGALGSRSSVIFDLDNDGDLDIITNDFNSEPMVLISNLTEKKKIHWLKVKLICTVSNRSGLGATVTVRAGSQTYTKVRDGKSGYLSQSLYPLYFGLGDADNVREIEVLWPSGRKQVVSGPIKLNELIEIAEQ